MMYDKNMQQKNLLDNYPEIIDQMLINKCSHDELYLFIENNPIFYSYIFDLVSEYIITSLKSDDTIIDNLLKLDKNFILAIQKAICKCTSQRTTHVDLYKKYCKTTVELFSLSMLYNNDGTPSDITEYIISENILNNIKDEYLSLEFLSKCNNLDTRFKIITFIVDTLHLDINNFFTDELFSELYEEHAIIIMEKIYSDEDIYNFIFPIIRNCSISNIKIIMDKYAVDTHMLIKIIYKIDNYDIFMYLMDLIGISEFNQDSFTEVTYWDYDIITWLCENGFKYEPWILLLADYKTTLIIIKHTQNYEYIKKYTDSIIRCMINNDDQMELFDIVPVDIFDLNIVFELAFINEKYDMINMLINNGFRPTNISEIKNELNVLEKYSVLDYIKDNYNIFG